MHILHLQEITCIQWSEWKYRTGRSIKLHPRRWWVALEVMSSVFPSWVLSQEMPCTSVCSRSKSMLSVLLFWRLELVPFSQVHQHSEYSLFLSPSVPAGSYKTFSAARDPLLSRGFFIPHIFVPMLSKMRSEASTSSLCSPLPITSSSSPGSLTPGVCVFPSPPCQQEHNP